ncbi:MAG: YceI family protein [Acidobacteriota bacterium]|nr:YceI family protein [Acidobacteriota bacterium]
MKRILLSVAAAFLAVRASGQTPTEFKIDDAWGRDSVRFETTAPVEDIVGTNNQISGFVRADPANIRAGGTAVRVEVDVAAFKTGVEARDGGVRKALGSEAHPKAVFTLDKITSSSSDAAAANTPVDVTGQGTFELNGVKKPMEVKARVTYVPKGGPFSKMRPGNFVRVSSAFDIRLADYGIERNGPVLPLQVGDTAHVSVSLLASDATPEETDAYRKGAAKYMGKPAH